MAHESPFDSRLCRNAQSKPSSTYTPIVKAGRRALIALLVVVVLLLVAAYAMSVNGYRENLRATFTPPVPQADGVAVVLIPYDVDAVAQSVPAEVLIFPGSDLVSAEGRLTRTISLDTHGAVSGTITFQRGTIPSPVRVDMPALGVVQEYPFDSYRYDVSVRSVLERGTGRTPVPTPIPLSLSVFFKVPGWNNAPIDTPAPFSSDDLSITGTISRAGTTITIVLIFLALIVMFGVLSVVTVIAGWRGRFELTIATAAWLTGALFALITLRNSLPGSPPLGSWMDILIYFWVIAVIMLMIGATVVTVVGGYERDDRDSAPAP